MNNHYRILSVSAQLLMQWLREERPDVKSIDHRLPDDCRIVDCQMDFHTPDTILLKLESAEFEEVPEQIGRDGRFIIPVIESPVFHTA